MIKNYLVDAFRNIKKRKGDSFINISGLTVGVACFILMLMWIQDEISFDRFHENASEIYRVIKRKINTANAVDSVITPNPLGPALKNEFPEIINFTRIDVADGWVVQYGEKRFTNDLIGVADSSIFEMFTFPFVKGNPKTVFNDKRSLVVTERFARKYFGDEEPMGKVLKMSGIDFKVAGVIKNIPNNSHIWFDCAFPIINAQEFFEWNLQSWSGVGNFYTYIQVRKGISWKELEKKISGIVRKHLPESNIDIYLQPFKDIHLKSKFDGDLRNYNQGDITYVYLLSLIALCILFIACFNYMNLSTARSADRAKAIAIRKVSGASRMDIIRQFLGEAIILSFIALIFSFILVFFLLPVFNNLSGKQLAFSFLVRIPFLLELIALSLVVGIISGSYPALLLSSFQPVNILKSSGSSPKKSGAYLRKILVVVQFSIAIFLIFSTIVIYTQLKFLRTKDLGFNPHNVITFFSAHQIEQNFEGKKALFMSNPNILNFCMGNAPMLLLERVTDDVSWEGKNPNERIMVYPSRIDYGYIELYQLKMVEGRSFSKQFSTDPSSFILNETAVKAMGLKNPVGKRLRINNRDGIIIGVVKDYHHQSLHGKILPVVLMLFYQHGNVSVRINPINSGEAVRFLENTWNKINWSPYPFTYSFIDETIANLYKSERKMGTIAQIATLFTLFISCLGLFGLASYTSRQRTKEIGIRKVSGASISSIVWLISKEFLKWIMAALIIACPLAWYTMNRWLQNYAYRTDIEWWMFVFTGLAALAIGFFTVSYQVIKAARANPIVSLKYE
ncbi:MAG TPA: ABC transporter permease [Candidatus Kapabacteria bacterium]|nr:ABC transporter permease [Candidatus Kapabacteria bacterium]